MASTPPHNFSWVDPDKVAGLALPRRTSEYQYLLDHGVKHLVCLCERKPPGCDSVPQLRLHHIDIVDFSPPSPAQIDRFLSIVEEANSKGEVSPRATLPRAARARHFRFSCLGSFYTQKKRDLRK